MVARKQDSCLHERWRGQGVIFEPCRHTCKKTGFVWRSFLLLQRSADGDKIGMGEGEPKVGQGEGHMVRKRGRERQMQRHKFKNGVARRRQEVRVICQEEGQ